VTGQEGGFDAARQQVTCRDCGRTYTCSPDDDYFGERGRPDSPTSGRCWDCMLTAGGLDPEKTRVEVIDANHLRCAEALRAGMAGMGDEVTVSTSPPAVAGPFTTDPFICPHGTAFWIEPTAAQLARWRAEGAE
jgi:hypothetical protein